MANESIRLYRTTAHTCGYFSDRESTNQVLEPDSPHLAQFFGRALAQGFRRAGDIVYRPDCAQCSACIAYRLPVARFAPNRAQRRVLAHNRDLDVRWRPAAESDDHYALYRRYVDRRHAGGGMQQPSPDDYRRFLLSRWASTCFLELRLGDRLVAAAVTDLVEDAASAIYTYFDPDESQRSLGTLCILKQVERCRELDLRHLYLGFWIDQHPKMHYKRQFGPAQIRWRGQWIDLARNDPPPV